MPIRALEWRNISMSSMAVCGVTDSKEGFCLGITWPDVDIVRTVKQFDDSWGGLGDGTLKSSAEWVAVDGGAVWTTMSGGCQHMCGMLSDGEIRCWGENWWGQLGDGIKNHTETASDRLSPARWGPPGVTNAVLSSGCTHTCAVTNQGLALCAGANQHGQLGSGDPPAGTREDAPGGVILRGAPALVVLPDVWKGNYTEDAENWVQNGSQGPWTSISAGADVTCAVDKNATGWCWGANAYGALGIGVQPKNTECGAGTASELTLPCTANTPQRVAGDHKWKHIEVSNWPNSEAGSVYVCGLTIEGRALCWGDIGVYDYIDNGLPKSQFSPQFVDTDTTYSDLTVGLSFACGIVAANATVQCWGADAAGQFGNPNITCYGSMEDVDYPWPCFSTEKPVEAAGGVKVRAITASEYSMYAILLNGTAMSWGWDQGQLGYGPLNKDSLALPRKPGIVKEPKARFEVPTPVVNGTDGDVGTQDPESSSSGISTGAVVGIIVGSVAAAGIAVVGGAWAYRRRRQRLKSSSTTSSLTKSADDDIEASLRVPDIAGADAALAPGSIKFDVGDNGKRVILGAGQYGTVYRGCLFGEAVAVKTMPLRLGSGAAAERLLAEVAVLKACRSDYVVQYRGHEVRSDDAGGRELLLATELMAGGDLRDALDEGHVSWKKGGARIALDVASGLQYLHSRSPRILHLDIKSKNVLLSKGPGDGTWRAKITDYGISQVLPESRSYLASNLAMQGTLAWAAPEQLLGQRCTVAADVFALGVVLWELATGEAPVRGRMREVQVPEECPAEVAELMARCWAAEPAARPSAAECVSALQNFI